MELPELVTDVLEAMADGIVAVDEGGLIAFANGQVATWTGYAPSELVGRPVELLVPQSRRDEHSRFRAGYQAAPVRRAMGADLDIQVRRKDGSEFAADVALSHLDTSGGRVFIAAVRDITDRREQERRLRHQRDEIIELSTPAIQVWDKVLVLPIIGTLDSTRAARLTEVLLQRIGDVQAEVVILDVSGVPTIDSQVAQHLLKTVQAAMLMGAASILCGVRPETAQSIVQLGVDLGSLVSRSSLRDALQLALQMLQERTASAESAIATVTETGPR